MTEFLLEPLINRCVSTIVEHAEALTELDQAIGDGDHGINMKRGFEAVATAREEILALDFGEALQKIGMTLVMKIGGASGPLFGSLFLGMGKATPACPQSFEEATPMLKAGIDLVRQRGKSEAGEKTLLEVLVPVMEALRHEDFEKIRQTADDALEKTRNMRATKGRASFLGERSVGHLDPGAKSAQLLVHAICDVLEVS